MALDNDQAGTPAKSLQGFWVFTDMMGNRMELNTPPRRIVSVVPSQTELLYDLGLDEEVVGITKFCVHPDEWFRSKKRVGGTKTLHIDIIKGLQPDLILANKEENTREQIEELSALYPTWVSNIQTIQDALQMIAEVGVLTERQTQAQSLISDIKNGFDQLHTTTPRRVAYFIWRKPWMCAGGDTFISHMIEKMGWVNVLADKKRYPTIELEELKSLDVEIAMLSSEPYPFTETHIAEIKEALPNAEVILVDGEMMSWYGSRMKKATGYLASLVQSMH